MKLKFALTDVVPNPFRDLAMFPLNEGRIEKLKESIGSTGFNENVVGRVREGKLQLAYGHHRVEALRRLDRKEADFIVQELSDDAMLEKMQTDNDPAYSHGMQTVIEGVRSAVLAFGEGKIKPEINKHTNHAYLRYAPSFIPGLKTQPTGSVPYTALSVAEKLNATQPDGHGKKRANYLVQVALVTLEMVERGYWRPDEYQHFVIDDNGLELSQYVAADRLSRVAKDTFERAKHGVLVAQINSAAATAAVQEAQQQIDALRKEEAEKKGSTFRRDCATPRTRRRSDSGRSRRDLGQTARQATEGEGTGTRTQTREKST